ncbi:MAG: DUF58 domain-containing protein [Haloferacaceae archaeon]
MRVTRRFWTVAAVGLVLAVGAVVFRRPVLLGGAAAVAAWLLSRQYRFVRDLTTLDAALAVDQSLATDRVATDDPVALTLAASLDAPSSLAVTVAADPPVATTGSTAAERRLDLSPGETGAATTVELRAPVAGVVTFDEPTVHARDAAGLFATRFDRGPTPTLTVDPRTTRDLHVGQGGDRAPAAYGRHEGGRRGTGIEPAEVREYVPGDAGSRIDWKASARLDQLFVREFEAETDRTTLLLVDHRGAMGDGRPGQTKLDYAREAALLLLDHAASLDDAVGLVTVGDESVTGRFAPQTGDPHYATLRKRLAALRPTGRAGSRTDAREGHAPRSPASARRAAQALRADDSSFGTTLRPYFETRAPYVTRVASDPLFGAASRVLPRVADRAFTVIVTDDTNRAELRETVKLVRRGESGVAVFLTPSALFDPDDLTDLDAAYERYREFEEFRRSLARMDGVVAYEVAPGDRLGRLLAARRQRRTATRPEVTPG